MKRKIDFLIVALFAVVLFASCERVAPNYAGVLMENYGKQGKEDFKIVFSSLCKSSRVRCIRSTAVDTTKSLFVHIRMPLLWRQTNKWRNWKTLSFCGKNARIASRVR